MSTKDKVIVIMLILGAAAGILIASYIWLVKNINPKEDVEGNEKG